MNKKKILICYHSGTFGGVEKQIIDLVRGLHNEFDIYTVIPDGEVVEECKEYGIVKNYNFKPKAEYDLFYSYKMFKICKKNKIDIVHSHELLGGLSIFGAFLAGVKKRVYHVHTPFVFWQHKSSLKRYFSLIINTFVNFFVSNVFATDVIALTPYIKSVRIKKEFVFPSKIRVIPNGVDESLFKFNEKGRSEIRDRYRIGAGAIVIGYNARFTAEKGHDVLIKAFSKFLKNNQKDNIYLLLSGGGILLAKMKELAKDLNLKDKVIFTDKYPEEDRIPIYSAMDIFVFPTLAEGFGFVLVEAMMMGLPVIASDLPVLKDVAKDSVLYANTGDINDFFEKIEYLINNEKMQKEHKQKGLNRSGEYTMKIFWDNYRKLYLGIKL